MASWARFSWCQILKWCTALKSSFRTGLSTLALMLRSCTFWGRPWVTNSLKFLPRRSRWGTTWRFTSSIGGPLVNYLLIWRGEGSISIEITLELVNWEQRNNVGSSRMDSWNGCTALKKMQPTLTQAASPRCSSYYSLLLRRRRFRSSGEDSKGGL